MPRARLSARLTAGISAGVSAAAVVLTALLVAGGVAAADPATEKQGPRTLAVSEASDLPDTDAGVTVTGSGFDPTVEVYLAVCRADIAESDPLTDCLGGPVPAENATAGWAQVTSEPAGKRNATAFAEDGSFSLDLTLASAADAGVDCVAQGCVLLARSAGEEPGRPKDITIGLGFAAPTSSASTTTTSTSEAPSTVGPDSVALPDAYLGQQQTVVFTGFTPGEEVAVTVFSEPVDIDGIVATAGGVVAITFPIGDALIPGTHTVQAIGRQSGLVGLATFTVVPAPAASSASSSAPSSTAESSAPSSAPTSEVTSSAAVTTGAATTSGSAAPVEPADSGDNLVWLWVTLALLVVAIAVGVAVTTSRRNAQRLEQERLDREQELAAMADEHPPTWAGGTGAPYTSPTARTGYQPYDAGQSGGLLSGREGDGPALYSGQGGDSGPAGEEPPTRWIDPADRGGDPPTTAIRPGAGDTPADPAGAADPAPPPSTQRFDPPADDPTAPRTEQWSPFGNDEPGGEPPPRR